MGGLEIKIVLCLTIGALIGGHGFRCVNLGRKLMKNPGVGQLTS